MELQKKLIHQLVASWEWDIPTGNEYWSDHFYEILGFKREEINAHYAEWERRLHPEDRKHTLAAVKCALDNKANYRVDYRILCKDESYKWVRAQGYVIYDDEGNPMCMGGTLEDVSDLYRQKELLEQANQEIKQHMVTLEDKATQLEAANQQFRQFAYAASHDLREPVRVIQGYARLVNKMNLNIDQDANNYIQNMAAGAKRMEDMIDGLLIYSRIARDESVFNPVDTNKVFHDTLKALGQQILDNEAKVTSDVLPKVMGINSQLQQLLQNLISNAIKFKSPIRAPKIHITSLPRNADMTCFEVSDNGIGIECDQYDRVFQLFKQLHPQGVFTGQGVGLALCKQIVERHGGRIWVESNPGFGSRFCFTLKKA